MYPHLSLELNRLIPQLIQFGILIFRREFDKCRSLLERALTNNAQKAFNDCGKEFPEDGNWKKYLPASCKSAVSDLEKRLCRVKDGCWERIRTPLEEGRYYDLCSDLMQNYQNNKKLLKKIGIQVGEKADVMMEEMMQRVEIYR